MSKILIGFFVLSAAWCYYVFMPLIKSGSIQLAFIIAYIPFNLALIISFQKSLRFYKQALDENRINLSALNTKMSCEEEYRFQAAFAIILLSLFYCICVFFYYTNK